MSLQIRTASNSLGNLFVLLEGELEIESCIILKKQLIMLAKKNPCSIITLDFQRLEFVGASGIGHLVEIVQHLVTSHVHIKIANLRAEFIRVFKLYNFDPCHLLVDDFKLDSEQETPVGRSNRKSSEI
ncbi:MAG: STAS domain-containing protein [Bdellovibrio sp.]|nr:STAS domain-containing protein [Bdellovibrio sp.]